MLSIASMSMKGDVCVEIMFEYDLFDHLLMMIWKGDDISSCRSH